MISKSMIALSLAATLASASAAMAATHRPHDTLAQPRAGRAEASASYAQARGQNPSGLHYYDADDNGSVWAFYPGYVPIDRK